MPLVRNKPFVVLAALFMVVLALWLRPTPPPKPISKATYDRIKLGMAEEEVKEVVGIPPDLNYGEGADQDGPGNYFEEGQPAQEPYFKDSCSGEKGVFLVLHRKSGETLGRELHWWGDDFSISVVVDQAGKVVYRTGSVRTPTGDFLVRFKRWLFALLP